MDFFQHRKVRSKKEVQVFGCSKEDSVNVGAVAHVCLLFFILCINILQIHSNQFQDDMEKLEKLLDTAVGQYQDGLPLHLSDPTRSAIAILSATDFACKTPGEIQEILRTKHILISDCEHDPNFKFDKAGLDTLCLSMHPIEVQGKSPSIPYIHFLLSA